VKIVPDIALDKKRVALEAVRKAEAEVKAKEEEANKYLAAEYHNGYTLPKV